MILIVAATATEVSRIAKGLALNEGEVTPIYTQSGVTVSVLVTGIGAAPTAYHLGRVLENKSVQLVVNIGIAGSYNQKLAIGDVALVTHDIFADYGIDDNGQFKTLSQQSLVNQNSFPYTDGWLINTSEARSVKTGTSHLKKIKGVTVSTATGSAPLVNKWRELYNPDIETMEGAAVFYSCLQAKKQFVCLRAMSNRVEPRNKNAWNIPLAIGNLAIQTEELLKHL